MDQDAHEAAFPAVRGTAVVHLPGVDEQAVAFSQQDRLAPHSVVHLSFSDPDKFKVVMPVAERAHPRIFRKRGGFYEQRTISEAPLKISCFVLAIVVSLH